MSMCWHKWSKWENKAEGIDSAIHKWGPMDPRSDQHQQEVIVRWIIQTRTCEKCGKSRQRKDAV